MSPVDGADALDRVHAARPDVILLDLMMPGMNGRQFLQALRDDKAYSEVPVLIMTAVHGLEINLAAIGASEVVEKPFDLDDLLNKVALAVYRSRDANALDAVADRPSSPNRPRSIAAWCWSSSTIARVCNASTSCCPSAATRWCR